MNKTIPIDLTNFSYVDFTQHLPKLEAMAQKENWNYKNANNSQYNNPILFNYIVFTFKRLATLYNNDNNSKYIIFQNKLAIINTGLMTNNFERIYMLFKENATITKQKYFCLGFFKESSMDVQKFLEKPQRATYITKLSDLLYDTKIPLSINIGHILDDPENIKRLPAHLQNSPTLLIAFQGAIEVLKKKLELNYKIAVPQFYNNKAQLLLPICLQNNDTPDIVLAVEKHGKYYSGHTCLTLDMAYNNARLISKPETDWLINIVK